MDRERSPSDQLCLDQTEISQWKYLDKHSWSDNFSSPLPKRPNGTYCHIPPKLCIDVSPLDKRYVRAFVTNKCLRKCSVVSDMESCPIQDECLHINQDHQDNTINQCTHTGLHKDDCPDVDTHCGDMCLNGTIHHHEIFIPDGELKSQTERVELDAGRNLSNECNLTSNQINMVCNGSACSHDKSSGGGDQSDGDTVENNTNAEAEVNTRGSKLKKKCLACLSLMRSCSTRYRRLRSWLADKISVNGQGMNLLNLLSTLYQILPYIMVWSTVEMTEFIFS